MPKHHFSISNGLVHGVCDTPVEYLVHGGCNTPMYYFSLLHCGGNRGPAFKPRQPGCEVASLSFVQVFVSETNTFVSPPFWRRDSFWTLHIIYTGGPTRHHTP